VPARPTSTPSTAAAKAEIDRALAEAEAAPWPEVAAAYEDIMDTGAGVWR
jgi:TPP-dependent pyruvate/acetoin dehydrogenase alpha subunit